MRKTNGNRSEPSPPSFWAEGSDKRSSILHLRPNLQPIYHLPRQGCSPVPTARATQNPDRGEGQALVYNRKNGLGRGWQEMMIDAGVGLGGERIFQCAKAMRDHLGRHARRGVWNDEKSQGWQRCMRAAHPPVEARTHAC